jgi:ribose 5-phosphate isomerase RpiB
MNVICLGGRNMKEQKIYSLVKIFLGSRFKSLDPYLRRLNKVKNLEKS